MKKLEDLLKTETDKRLLKLFAVGCCRQIWHLLKDQRSKTAVEVAERFADGKATKKELNKASNAAHAAANAAPNATAYWAANAATCAADYIAAYWVASNAAHATAHATAHDAAYWAAHAATTERQLKLYHCIFTKFVFSTTSQNALTLARLIYLERQWHLMPILGDALEEAGTINEAVNHCKEKEHARGCCVVDNLLGHRK